MGSPVHRMKMKKYLKLMMELHGMNSMINVHGKIFDQKKNE
jgi:hypothetical protein